MGHSYPRTSGSRLRRKPSEIYLRWCVSFTYVGLLTYPAIQLDFWARVADPVRVDEIRRRMETPTSPPLFFYTLKHIQYNEEYFDELEALTEETLASTASRGLKRRRGEY